MIENEIVGGAIVLFESVIENLRLRANVEPTVVSTTRPRARRGRLGRAFLNAPALLEILVRTWRAAARAHLIVWFVSPRATLLSGGLVWPMCKLRRRPLCIRLFGGSFDVFLESAPAVCRFIAHRKFLRAELLAETRRSAARSLRCRKRCDNRGRARTLEGLDVDDFSPLRTRPDAAVAAGCTGVASRGSLGAPHQ